MNFENISIITGIIKRERNTSNLIYTLKLRGYELEATSLKHSDCIYSLMRTLSTMGFNMELEGPWLLDLNDNSIMTQCLNDISLYLKHMSTEDERLRVILINLIDIKTQMLQHLNESSKQLMPPLSPDLIQFNVKDGQLAHDEVDSVVYDAAFQPLG